MDNILFYQLIIGFLVITNIMTGVSLIRLSKKDDKILKSAVDGAVENITNNQKIIKDQDTLISLLKKKNEFVKGGKCIVNHELVWRDKEKDEFSVVYECNIEAVSDNKVKVNAYDFSSGNSRANETKNRSGILWYAKEKWFEKSKCEVIVDENIDELRRGLKIESLLNG